MHQFISFFFALLAVLASFVHHPHEIGPAHESNSLHPPSIYSGKWALGSAGNGPLRDGIFISRDLIHFAETVFVRNQSDCTSLHATDVRIFYGKVNHNTTDNDNTCVLISHVVAYSLYR